MPSNIRYVDALVYFCKGITNFDCSMILDKTMKGSKGYKWNTAKDQSCKIIVKDVGKFVCHVFARKNGVVLLA